MVYPYGYHQNNFNQNTNQNMYPIQPTYSQTSPYIQNRNQPNYQGYDDQNVKTEELVSRGLANMGSTCYFNSALQCLGHTMALTNLFCDGLDFSAIPHGIGYVYQNLIREMWAGGRGPVYPKAIFEKLKGLVKNQESDPVEAMVSLIQRLDTEVHELTNPPKGTKSDIENILFNETVTRSTCYSCFIEKEEGDQYTILPLSIPKGPGPITLNSCLEQFFKEKGRHKTCERCKYGNLPHREVTNFLDPPNYIIFTVVRDIKVQKDIYGRNNYPEYNPYPYQPEIASNIIAPFKLNLSKYISKPDSKSKPFHYTLTTKNPIMNYELYAIMNHSGQSNLHGHETAYCKNPFNRDWYEYNDSYKRVITCQDVERSDKGIAYFYVREDLCRIGGAHVKQPSYTAHNLDVKGQGQGHSVRMENESNSKYDAKGESVGRVGRAKENKSRSGEKEVRNTSNIPKQRERSKTPGKASLESIDNRKGVMYGGQMGRNKGNDKDVGFREERKVVMEPHKPHLSASSNPMTTLSLAPQWHYQKIDSQEPAPLPRWGHTATFIPPNKILLFGGQYKSPERYLNDVFVYTMGDIDRWSEHKVTGYPPLPRCHHTAVLTDSGIIILGGKCGASYVTNTMYILNRANYRSILSKASGSIYGPFGLYAHTATLVDFRYMFVFGGTDGNRCFNDLFIYHIEQEYWKQCSTFGPLPARRMGHAAILVNQDLIIHGGKNKIYDGVQSKKKHYHDIYLNDIYVLNTLTFTWTTPKTSGSCIPRIGHTLTLFDEQIVMFGGNTEHEKDMGKGDNEPPSGGNCQFFMILEGNKNQMTWSFGNYSALVKNRYGHTTTAISDKLYGDSLLIFGGWDNTGVNNEVIKLSKFKR